jgi:hypothetical protein
VLEKCIFWQKITFTQYLGDWFYQKKNICFSLQFQQRRQPFEEIKKTFSAVMM